MQVVDISWIRLYIASRLILNYSLLIMTSLDNQNKREEILESATPEPASNDSILERLDKDEVLEIIDYIKKLNSKGLLTAVIEYSKEKHELNVGDMIIVGPDLKDKEVESRDGRVVNGYSSLLYKKVCVTEINEAKSGLYKIKVEELVDENEERKPLVVWISAENVLIMD